MTRVRIFNSVDLPEPFTPTSPTASPGSTTKSTSSSAQRHPRRPRPVSRFFTWAARARIDCRVGSARKRFQMSVAAMVPSGDIGEPRLHALEEEEGDAQPQRAGHGGDREQAQPGRLAEEHATAEAVDERAERVCGGVHRPPRARDLLEAVADR